MGKGQGNKGASQNRRMKRHMQKTLGFTTFSDRVKAKLKKKSE